MPKINFHQNYKGPRGKHLSFLTKLTREGEIKTEGTMHPGRQQFGRRYNPRISLNVLKNGDLAPITLPRNSNRKGYLARASHELDRRRRDQDMTKNIINRTAGMTWAEGMYKVPGSMQI